MRRVLAVEMRRCLARRLTRVLIGLALVASAVAGIVVFANSEDATPAARAAAEARREADVAACAGSIRNQRVSGPGGEEVERVPPPAALSPAGAEAECRRIIDPGRYDRSLHLVDLWDREGDDSFLLVTFVFLAVGAVIGGASMVGADWKAGTVTTLLTWEPRRTRVAVAKVIAAALLAAVTAVLLQLAFVACLLPTVAFRGTTAGADAEWLRTLLGGVARGAALTGMGALAGASIAMVGRSTSAALGSAFAYLAVFEAVVRAWKPSMSRWLIIENSAIFLGGRRLEGAPFERPVTVAALTLAAMAVAFVATAAATFRARDVAG